MSPKSRQTPRGNATQAGSGAAGAERLVPPAPEAPERAVPPELERRPNAPNERWLIPGVCLFLAAIVWAVFGQTLGFGFVYYDDDTYVYNNPQITGGLSFRSLIWAFTHIHSNNWHPLTTLTHMLDCQLYGLHPWGHHLDNVILHGVAAILLFLALRQMTGSLWRSAFAAAIFAVHPLRVESVAWVSERKDVLSGVFFMLTLLAYVRYERNGRSRTAYLAVMLCFALGLMSKPTVVPLPFVLLLLDWWPLGRIKPGSAWSEAKPLVLEKIPLFALSIASCLATSYAQKHAMSEAISVSLPYRVANAAVSYAVYLIQMVWPANLAVLYPHPGDNLQVWEAAGALLLLAAVTTAVCMLWKRQSWLAVGWLWYLGMLVPVIGIVQVGKQAHADRYTYLPQIGLYVAATWAAAELAARLRLPRWASGVLSAGVLAALVIGARQQATYWHDSESLWNHTLACTENNYVAHLNLGNDLQQKGRLDEAIAHFQTAIQIKGSYAEGQNNLGSALKSKGELDEAIAHFQRAIEIDPGFAEAEYNLGNAYQSKGDLDDAIAHFQNATEIKPGFAEAYNNLGNVYQRKGALIEAMTQFERAIQINSAYAEAYDNLGNAYQQTGAFDEAIAEYQRALEIRPSFVEALSNLGVAYGRKGQLDEAIVQFQRAIRTKPDYAEAQNNLGILFGREGRFDDAIAQYQKAIQIKPDYADALKNYAYLLATCSRASVRDGARAMELAGKANRLAGGGNAAILDALAAADAEAGRFPEAVETEKRAIEQNLANGPAALAITLDEHLKLYQAGQPLRENP